MASCEKEITYKGKKYKFLGVRKYFGDAQGIADAVNDDGLDEAVVQRCMMSRNPDEKWGIYARRKPPRKQLMA